MVDDNGRRKREQFEQQLSEHTPLCIATEKPPILSNAHKRKGLVSSNETSRPTKNQSVLVDSPTNNERVRKHLTDNASYAPVRESTLETSRRMQVAGRNAHTVATGVVDPRMEGLRSETMWQCFSIGWYKLNSDGVSRTSDGICSVLKAKL
ncbi:hypothetical protein V6N11_038388 [Hibiscus sabdariffa]|uniref:Uncharacterized protein n=1 Tax=Hibiscus sabdariffa TaxID=183260 RepID=A0ABR2SKH4_9ROSI